MTNIIPNRNVYRDLIQELSLSGARLVAVSKTKTADEINRIYNMGQRIFGENRALELRDKAPLLPSDIEWHMIGHLQTNKVKYIAPFVQMIQSCDSDKLLKEINKHAYKNERIIDVLLEFKIATESTKYGLNIEDTYEIIKNSRSLDYVRICGVMGMATFTDDDNLIRSEFRALKSIFDQLKQTYYSDIDHFNEISMGMSGDYKIALEEGATMVRIGSLIFGPRV